MKEGVFEETVEILEDYVPRESYVIPASTSTTKRSPMKIKYVSASITEFG